MRIFDKFNGDIEVYKYSKKADEEDKIKLNKYIGFNIPRSYMWVINYCTELEIKVGIDGYLRIWDALGCIEMSEAYYFKKYLKDFMVFGDDGGGNVLVFMKGNRGNGIYMIPFGDIDPEEAIYITKNLYRLLIKGEGLEFFK